MHLDARQPARGGADPARGRAGSTRSREDLPAAAISRDQQPRGRASSPPTGIAGRVRVRSRRARARATHRRPVWEANFLAGPISALVLLGRWDEALARAAEGERAARRRRRGRRHAFRHPDRDRLLARAISERESAARRARLAARTSDDVQVLDGISACTRRRYSGWRASRALRSRLLERAVAGDEASGSRS